MANGAAPRTEERANMRDRDMTRGYSRAQFVAKLRRLADAIEAERPFTIQVGGERLRIPAAATFNIEHERSGNDEELEFQLLWKGR
jgi:amphi-Trp domain-containing protein